MVFFLWTSLNFSTIFFIYIRKGFNTKGGSYTMAWYTDLFCRIVFNDKSYNDLCEVEDDLDTAKRLIKTVEDELFGLVMMTEPNKMLSKSIEEDECDAMDILRARFNQCMESLEEYCLDRDKLDLLVYNWKKCHNDQGLAIAPPDEMDWDDCYMDGDFIKTVKDKNTD